MTGRIEDTGTRTTGFGHVAECFNCGEQVHRCHDGCKWRHLRKGDVFEEACWPRTVAVPQMSTIRLRHPDEVPGRGAADPDRVTAGDLVTPVDETASVNPPPPDRPSSVRGGLLRGRDAAETGR